MTIISQVQIKKINNTDYTVIINCSIAQFIFIVNYYTMSISKVFQLVHTNKYTSETMIYTALDYYQSTIYNLFLNTSLEELNCITSYEYCNL